MASLTNLISLNLSGIKITKENIYFLNSLKKLKELHLLNTSIEKRDLHFLSDRLPPVKIFLDEYENERDGCGFAIEGE